MFVKGLGEYLCGTLVGKGQKVLQFGKKQDFLQCKHTLTLLRYVHSVQSSPLSLSPTLPFFTSLPHSLPIFLLFQHFVSLSLSFILTIFYPPFIYFFVSSPKSDQAAYCPGKGRCLVFFREGFPSVCFHRKFVFLFFLPFLSHTHTHTAHLIDMDMKFPLCAITRVAA